VTALALAFVAVPTGCAAADSSPAGGDTDARDEAVALASEPSPNPVMEEAAPVAEADTAAFRKFDANRDGVLSGTELTACRCGTWDMTGDGRVSLSEFLAGEIMAAAGVAVPTATRRETPPAQASAQRATPAANRATPASAPRPSAQPARAAGEAPFTRSELLALIRSMPGYQDYNYSNAARKEASDRQVRMIETRGVDFRFDFGTFDPEFHAAGASTDVKYAVSRNYRAPGSAPRAIAGPSALVGRYDMGAAGSTTRYDQRGSRVVRTDRDVGFAGGSLVIGADGRYEWRLTSTGAPLRGAWREATQAEMGASVGPALVLTGAYEGADWIVTPFAQSPADKIAVNRLDQKFRWYLGTRAAR
jgi:hypothetical protein